MSIRQSQQRGSHHRQLPIVLNDSEWVSVQLAANSQDGMPDEGALLDALVSDYLQQYGYADTLSVLGADDVAGKSDSSPSANSAVLEGAARQKQAQLLCLSGQFGAVDQLFHSMLPCSLRLQLFCADVLHRLRSGAIFIDEAFELVSTKGAEFALGCDSGDAAARLVFANTLAMIHCPNLGAGDDEGPMRSSLARNVNDVLLRINNGGNGTPLVDVMLEWVQWQQHRLRASGVVEFQSKV